MYSLELLAFLTSIGAKKFFYPVQGVIPAVANGGTVTASRTIQNDNDFLAMSFCAVYPTVNGGVDDGVCRIQAKIQDGGSQLTLCDDFLNLACIATPGRRRTAAIAGDDSLGLGIPGFPFLHLFPANGAINIELKNSADTIATVDFVFEGFKVRPEMRDRLIALLNPMNEAMPQG